jgi:methyl-accepting chemotaxis protein
LAQEGGQFYEYYFPKPDTEESFLKMSTAVLIPGTNMWVGAGRYIDSIEANKTVIAGQVNALTRQTVWMVLAGFFGLAVVVLTLVGLMTQKITRPIKTVAAVAQNVAQGDLSQQIVVDRQDEVGQLADSFRQLIAYLQNISGIARNIAGGDLATQFSPVSERDVLGTSFVQMITSLRSLVEQIAQSSAVLTDSSVHLAGNATQVGRTTDQLAGTIQQVATGTGQQADSVAQTANLVDQMSRAVESVTQGAQLQSAAIAKSSTLTAQISAAIEQVTENARTGSKEAALAAEATRHGTQTVEDTIRGMHSIKAKIGLLAEKVREMGQRSSQIGAIVETIDEIAGQTNLLALNAAIEAARAGEHGKGFAVVADEVRKLAEKSAGATSEISDLIGTIQQTVLEAVQAMDEGAKEIEAGVIRANQSGNALTSIMTAAEAVSQQVESIAASAQHMNVSARELVGAMDSVTGVVQETTTQASEMMINSTQVTDAINAISNVGQENRAAIKEVSASTEEMTAQANEVATAAQDLNQLAQSLRALVARFKLDTPGTVAVGVKPSAFDNGNAAVRQRNGYHTPRAN